MVMKKIGLIFIFFVLLSTIIIGTGNNKSLNAAPNNQRVDLGHKRINYSSPVAADLNGNGRKEIVIGASDGWLYVVGYTGSNWVKLWERQTALDLNTKLDSSQQQSTGIIDSAPAIGDIDNDGKLEIVVSTGGTPNSDTPSVNRNGGIIVYELIYSAGSNWSFAVKPGWPFLMDDDIGQGPGGGEPDGVRDGIKSTPTLGDIDGDGDLEIISIADDRRIRAFHHDGSVVAGWPIQRASGDIILRGSDASAAIADIDNDGLNEIIIGTNSPPWNGDNRDGPFPPQYNIPDYSLATLWAINGDSTLVSGFPVITQQGIKSSPAIGDIDGDGDLEIVVGTGDYSGYQNGRQVYAWHHNGTPVAGWPKATDEFMLASPALADLDNNGVLDVIISCGYIAAPCPKLYAWNGSGSNLPGFPANLPADHLPFNFPSSPVVADIDGDNNLEVILASLGTTKIMVVQHDGNNGTFNTSRTVDSDVYGVPLIDDLDNDGYLETVVGAAANAWNGPAALFIFDEANSTDADPNHLPWPMFQRNTEHTALVLPPKLGAVSDIDIFHQQGSGSTANHNLTIKNEGGGSLTWNVNASGTGGAVSVNTPASSLDAGENTAVSLSVNTSPYAVGQWHNLGTIQISATSPDGTVVNSPQTVTVRLFVGDISHIYLPAILRQ